MPKIKPEKIAGIVALSYLVLIPAAGVAAYLKMRTMDQDLLDILTQLNMEGRADRSGLPSTR
jgi:hypothetical protein